MRDEKQLLLNEIKEKIDSSKAMIIARYEKLPPNNAWDLRARLAKKKSLFEVVRKRVFLKAAAASGVAIDEAMLKGNVSVVFVEDIDAIEPTKELFKFSEENGQSLEVLCGQIEGKFVPGKDLEVLSKLPSLNEMRANFIALLVSPMAQTLSVVEAAIAAGEQKNEQK